MMVKIVTDSTCDLPREVAEELGITVIPVNVHFGDEVYKDGIELSTDEFYRRLRTNSTLPKTSVPSPGTFRELYQMLARKSDAIVSIHVAAAMSATCESAKLGAAEVKHPISIVDSQTASMACGLLAVIAARAAREGAGLADIEALLKDTIPRTITYGVFSTMEYLYKGGRIGRAQAFLGNILKISPVLAIRRGEILPIARVRTRARAIDRLCEIVSGLGTLKEMSVMQTTDPDEAEALAQRLAHVFPKERMIRATLGPAMGTYVGPNAVGVALIAEKPF
jgi:DegV family protein with EDD domain